MTCTGLPSRISGAESPSVSNLCALVVMTGNAIPLQ
jgi:hypothetical protein